MLNLQILIGIALLIRQNGMIIAKAALEHPISQVTTTPKWFGFHAQEVSITLILTAVG